MESVEVKNVSSCMQANNNEDHEALLKKLQLLHCPFTWVMPNTDDDVKNALQAAEIKEKYLICFSSPLIRCFEYAKSGNLNHALEVLQGWNLDQRLDVLLKLEECSEVLEQGDKADNSKDLLYKLPFYHVYYSCECFIHYKLEHFEECEETLKRIVPFENLSSEGQAEVYGVQGDVIKQYGYTGVKQAIKILEDAQKLYPKSVVMLRLLGKLYGRIRRVEDRNAIPDFHELKALEDTLKESYDHPTAVHLALVYREYGRNLKRSSKKHDKDTLQVIENMNCKAAEIYSKAYDNHENDYNVLTRVAEGFIRLPPPWRDLEKARVCLEGALEICKEDPYLNHTAGTFFTLKGDLEKAKVYLNLSSHGMTTNYGACIDLILIKQALDSQYNPMEDLESLLKHFSVESYVEDILCNLGAFVYVEMDDFGKAFEYWVQVIKRNINSKRLTNHYCGFIRPPPNVSINRIVVHELQKKLRENLCSDEEKAILDNLLALYPNLKESYFERNRFDGVRSKSSSQSRRWSGPSEVQSMGKEEGSWRRKEPLPPIEKDRGADSSSKIQDSHFNWSSYSSNWRWQHYSTDDTSEDSAKVEKTSYYRPGSRFGRDSAKGDWWRTTGHSASTSAVGQESKGSFRRREENSSRPPETENWRSRPAKHAEDIGK